MDDYLFYAPAKEREQRLRQLAEAAEVLRRDRAAKRARRRMTGAIRSPEAATRSGNEFHPSPEALPTFDDAA